MNAFARKKKKPWNKTVTGFQEGQGNRLIQSNISFWFNQSFIKKTDDDPNISAGARKIILPKEGIGFELNNTNKS